LGKPSTGSDMQKFAKAYKLRAALHDREGHQWLEADEPAMLEDRGQASILEFRSGITTCLLILRKRLAPNPHS